MRSIRSIRALIPAAWVLLAALSGTAQTAASPPNSTQAPALQDSADNNSAATAAPAAKPKEVSLLAVVRNKKGDRVDNLDKQDFVLEQDGHAQTITELAHDTSLPLTIGVVADTGAGQRKSLGDERKASTDFLKRLLRDGDDHGFVLHFDREVELLQDITASQDKLARGIDLISAAPEPAADSAHGSGSGHGRGSPEPEQERTVSETLYDALFLSADEVLHGQPGRKAIVLFSDGLDRESKTSLARAIEAAQRAEVLVYCIYVASEREERRPDFDTHGGGIPGGGGSYPGGGPYPGGGGPYPGGGPFPGGGGPFPRRGGGPESTPKESKADGKKILQQIANETGGRFFELNNKKLNAAQIYVQIEEELRHQYSLRYTPDQAGNGFHRLRVTTRKPDMTVQTRSGFYAE